MLRVCLRYLVHQIDFKHTIISDRILQFVTNCAEIIYDKYCHNERCIKIKYTDIRQ